MTLYKQITTMKKLSLILFFLSLFFASSQPIQAAGATLKFIPGNLEFNLGNVQTAQIHLDPKQNNVIGVDLFIRFDPQFIKVNNVTGLGIFSTRTALLIDNNAGLVKTAFSNGYGTYQTKPDTFARIEFEGKNVTNQTTISFDFILGKTNDTNVAISLGRDVLDNVSPILLKINPYSGPEPSSTPQPDVSPTPSPNSSSPSPQASGRPRPSPFFSPRPSPTVRPRPTPTPFVRPSPRLNPTSQPPWWRSLLSLLPWFRGNNNDQVLGTTSQPSIFSLNNGLLLLAGLAILFITIKLLRKFVFKEKEQNPDELK